MSANRILVLVGVLIAVLFGISLALGQNKKDLAVDPNESFVNKLNFKKSTKIPPADISAKPATLKEGTWTLANLIEGSLEITNSRSEIRTLKVSLLSGSSCSLQFVPKPDAGEPAKQADPEAVPFKIDSFQPGRATSITVMKNGGTLIVRRKDIRTPSDFKIE